MHTHKKKHKTIQRCKKERPLPHGDPRGGLLELYIPRPMTLGGLVLASGGWEELEKMRGKGRKGRVGRNRAKGWKMRGNREIYRRG